MDGSIDQSQQLAAMLQLLAMGNQEIIDGQYQSLDDFLEEMSREA